MFMNLDNIMNTYTGFSTFPKPDEGGRLEITMTNFGEIETPWFGQAYKEGYYKEDKQQRVNIKFPGNIKDQLASGTLWINLDVDTREEEGWNEEVRFSSSNNIGYMGNKILESKMHKERKTWANAEAHCQSEGGHLASARTAEEQKTLRTLTMGHPV